MEIKNPIGKESGFSNDANSDDIKIGSDITTATIRCKQRCGSKNPPHSYEIDNHALSTHIYVGNDALTRAAEAYYWAPSTYPVAAMALPANRSAFEFDWPVKHRRVVILSIGYCDEIINELIKALVLCGAQEIIATLHNEPFRWVKTHKLEVVR